VAPVHASRALKVIRYMDVAAPPIRPETHGFRTNSSVERRATGTRAGTRAHGTSCPEELAKPLLNDGRIAHSLEPAQQESSVANARQDRLEELGQDRLAESVPPGDERRDEVPCALQAQVVGAEIALERRGIADLSPWQAATVATQQIHPAAHQAGEEAPDTGLIFSIPAGSMVDPPSLAVRVPLPAVAGDGRRRFLTFSVTGPGSTRRGVRGGARDHRDAVHRDRDGVDLVQKLLLFRRTITRTRGTTVWGTEWIGQFSSG